MAKTISASVGFNGVNRKADVIVVQQLLNQVPSIHGGPTPLLEVDGWSGPLTIGAIQRFQLKNFGWPGTDGRVDPGQQTLAKLNEYGTAPSVPPPPPPPPPEPESMDFAIIPSFQLDLFPEPLTSSQLTYLVIDVKNGLQRVYQLQISRSGPPAIGPFQGYFARFKPIRPTGVSGFEGTGVYSTTLRTNPGPPSRTTVNSSLFLFPPGGGTGISIPMKTHLFKPEPLPGTGGTMTTSVDGKFKIIA
ncbi:MAG: peptidoglycan-binding protein [Acidobacteria bacterium]|nr:peptidoglycan-binding protein [Acidobacteriota bacterium]MCK6683244.1 peptidoglycan-binding protein [Thermoanaerobaculia bacterium]